MNSPRISLNKLGEYLMATPARRRRIVLDQQDPKAFIVARYMDARTAIVDYLASGLTDSGREQLMSKSTALRLDKSGTEFAYQDRVASADAMVNFVDLSSSIDMDELIAIPVEGSFSAAMYISGVKVSVRPDVILRNWVTGDVVGAIKLHFPKTSPLSAAALGYVSTALRVYMEKQEGGASVDFKRCYVIDISTKSVVSAQKAHVKKMKDIEAACEEIFVRWVGLPKVA